MLVISSFYKAEAQGNQTVKNGENTALVTFDTTCSYTWTNSTPSIGLAASGTGDIASFKAINNTSSAVRATITATPIASGFAYIACYGTAANGGYIDVINTSTDTKAGTIPINPFPQAIAVTKTGDVLYTTNQDAGKNVKILTASNTVSPTSAMGYGIALAPNGDTYYYTSGTAGNSLFAVNTVTNSTSTISVGTSPFGVAVNSDGGKIYVANNGSNTVSVVNTSNNAIATINIGPGFKPYGIAIAKSSNNELVYVTNFGNNSVTVFQASNNGILAVITVGLQPTGVTASPGGAYAYVANKGDNTVSVISTATNKVIKTITVGTRPVGVSVTPDGKKVYVANSGSNNVSVINTTTNTVTSNIDVYDRPESLGNFISQGTCQAITLTITVNPAAVPSITATGPIAALNTVYGTSSTAGTFTVSGMALTAGIAVSPPPGFEVSIDDITFSNSLTIPVGANGNITGVKVFIRLKADAVATSYSGNVTLSSAGASDVAIATGGGTVAKAQLNITANNINKNYGTALTVVTGSTDFTSSGLKNGETIGSVTLTYGAGGAGNAAPATYPGSITPSAPTGGTFLISNYTLNPFAGNLTVNKAPLTITADDKMRNFGEPDPVFTITYTGFVNNEGTAQLTTQPVATITATINSLPGQYPITVTGASAANYTITYVAGVFTIVPVIQPITVPNAFTPNNDGINDTWEIQYLASSYPNCTVEVFNRDSKRVYFSNGYTVAWNGKYNGANLPFGTYYYVINTHSNLKLLSGYLTIIRYNNTCCAINLLNLTV
ncbi:MAG: gliding motility-associated C-terminal domain-containing protein [Mucilaginibacter sp.]|nr:gliding motility-associated C-terminal domain-containing protein [Mucilaginibacter sp.]